MQTLLTLLLGLSSIVSLYYLHRERVSYKAQLKINDNLTSTLKEIETIKNEMVVEQIRLKQVARKILSGAVNEPTAPEVPPPSDIRRKPWLN